MAKIYKRALLALFPVCSFALVMDLPTSQAEFELNFQSRGGGGDGGSRSGGGEEWEFSDGDMMQEMVTEAGQEYYHIVIGDPNQDDFAMDMYIQTASGGAGWSARSAGPPSASDGSPSDLEDFDDPFALDAGSGTGNPNRVYMRMILKENGFEQEYLKSTLERKPIITQSLNTGDYQDYVVLDMTNSTLSDTNTKANVEIHARVTDPNAPTSDGIASEIHMVNGEELIIDHENNGLDIQVTAGEWAYSTGSGPGGSSGIYTYVADSFDVMSVDWYQYCDPNQNSHNCNFSGSNGDRGGRRGNGGWGGGSGTTGGWGGGGWGGGW